MKNKVVILAVMAASVLGWADETKGTDSGSLNGELVGMYIHRDEALNRDIHTTVIAGEIHYETPSWNYLSATIAPYFSQKIGGLSGKGEDLNEDLLSSKHGSFVYLGEAYLTYAPNLWNIRIGRQALETPMANADNPRLHRNTHEGVYATYSGIESTTLNGGYLTRWAGYGTPGDFTRFHRFDADENSGGESDGMVVIGVESQPTEELGVKGWYFGIDNIADIYTADAEYRIVLSEESALTLYGQYVEYHERESSGYAGEVAGVAIEIAHGGNSLYVAYNHGNTDAGKQILAPYGRGPFLVDLEEFTIQGMERPRAWMVRGALECDFLPIEGIGMELMYGEFKMSPSDAVLSERAGVITYNEDKPFSARVSYAQIRDHNQNMLDGGDLSYDRFIASVHYKF